MLAPNPVADPVAGLVAGIDVGKTFLDLGFDASARAVRVRNDAAGVASLIGTLRQRGATRVAMEAIGPTPGP